MKRAAAIAVLISLVAAAVPVAACDDGGTAGGPASTTGTAGTAAEASAAVPAGLIQPADLVYAGAFRLPDTGDDAWTYSGTAMAYNPVGDPGGNDGFPGSLFATGIDSRMQVAEISIPAPVISAAKDPAELNRAGMLQPFHDLMGGFGVAGLELPRVGLAILPEQGTQAERKLYFCWGEHMSDAANASHGWAGFDMDPADVAGGWHVTGQSSFSTADYMCEIPAEWAQAYTPGLGLATGRYRDGGWSGQGPSLFAIGPWNEGDPPEPGTGLDSVPLILYTSSDDNDGEPRTMAGYHHSDEWSGAAWLTSGDRAALVFAGTKGHGEYWYGFANGVQWPDEPPYPEVPPAPDDERGWWSDSFSGQLIFYDPNELAAVASGAMEAYAPQPYAVLEIDDYLYAAGLPQKKSRVGAIDFDRERGLLYVFEPLADDDNSLVHVWRVT